MLQREKALLLERFKTKYSQRVAKSPPRHFIVVFCLFVCFAFKYELLNLKYKEQVIFNKNPQNRRKM